MAFKGQWRIEVFFAYRYFLIHFFHVLGGMEFITPKMFLKLYFDVQSVIFDHLCNVSYSILKNPINANEIEKSQINLT